MFFALVYKKNVLNWVTARALFIISHVITVSKLRKKPIVTIQCHNKPLLIKHFCCEIRRIFIKK